jgi:hypothetical protein
VGFGGENCVFERSEMLITIFATRFEGRDWKDWEHACTYTETEAVIDSANAKAFEHGGIREPVFIDYLEGARYVFDVAFGTKKRPRDGDTKVYGVMVGGMVIAEYRELLRHFALKLTA